MTNSASTINFDKLSVTRTIHIAAPIEKVWAAITEAQRLAEWFGEHAVLDEVSLGATGTIAWARSTVFRFTLEPIASGTQLTVVESGFETLSDPAASLEGNRGGWDFELDELVAYLEGGA